MSSRPQTSEPRQKSDPVSCAIARKHADGPSVCIGLFVPVLKNRTAKPRNPTLELQLVHTASLTPLLLTPSSAGYVQPNFAQDTETTEENLTAVMELVELEPEWVRV